MRLLKRLSVVVVLVAAIATPALAANAGGGAAFANHRGLVLGRQAGTGWTGSVQTTSNWAGYTLTNPDPTAPMAFTAVSGKWTVPKLKCDETAEDDHAAFWVGLGGYVDGTQALEQIGTWSDCNLQGPPSYFAWYELVPGPALSFAMKIEPGDTLTASVSVDTHQHVTLTLTNLTRHTVAIARQRDQMVDLSSAEWIAEAPTFCNLSSCAVEPLANFGSVAMSNLRATANGKSGTVTSTGWNATPLEIAPHTGTSPGTCTPTSLAGDGSSFAVSFVAAAQQGC
jgi:hypothetical protein